MSTISQTRFREKIAARSCCFVSLFRVEPLLRYDVVRMRKFKLPFFFLAVDIFNLTLILIVSYAVSDVFKIFYYSFHIFMY